MTHQERLIWATVHQEDGTPVPHDQTGELVIKPGLDGLYGGGVTIKFDGYRVNVELYPDR